MDKILRDGLEVILFHGSVKELLDNWRQGEYWHNIRDASSDLLVRRYPLRYSRNDAKQIFTALQKVCAENPNSGVFSLIHRFAGEVLLENGRKPVIRYEHVIRWRDATHRIGTLPFVMAFLANNDIQNHSSRSAFSFNPVLPTDNRRLAVMLEKGMAENHFHLKGSTPSFLLSWVYLMNNVTGSKDAFDKLAKHRLSSSLNTERLYHLVWCAASIRAFLFEKLKNLADEIAPALPKSEETCQSLGFELQCRIDSLREMFGAEIRQPFQRSFKPDYAVKKIVYDEDAEREWSIFSGENYFQYGMFRAIFANSASVRPYKNLFLAYLMIAAQFRGEMVQNNDSFGFDNFSEYQDRKDFFYVRSRVWDSQLSRIAARTALADKRLKSFEARIIPKSSSAELSVQLYDLNRSIRYPEDESKQALMFYVLHFPKKPDKPPENTAAALLHCRHWRRRKEVLENSNAIINLRESQSDVSECVLGIDACSAEISCRPEVFATAFRRLCQHQAPRFFSQERTPENLCATYHVGEDFLDIADGLRAVDEAILYLNLSQGCRLGHALALGIDPDDWYEKKHMRVVLPRQDLLDNSVWMYCKLSKAGLLKPRLASQLSRIFSEQVNYIFRQNLPHQEKDHYIDIECYWDSWHLRGDNPEFYMFYQNNRDFIRKLNAANILYPNLLKDETGYLRETRRHNMQAIRLYHHYHYNPKVKDCGAEVTELGITAEYRKGVRLLQQFMREKISRRNIGIETNPSSNVLIGNFNRYDKHPIVVFNDAGLINSPENKRLFVSINTDDQGVFDTSLENEYSLMARGLEQINDEDGNPRFTPSDVYAWLDMVRQMGIEQSFWNLQKLPLKSLH